MPSRFYDSETVNNSWRPRYGPQRSASLKGASASVQGRRAGYSDAYTETDPNPRPPLRGSESRADAPRGGSGGTGGGRSFIDRAAQQPGVVGLGANIARGAKYVAHRMRGRPAPASAGPSVPAQSSVPDVAKSAPPPAPAPVHQGAYNAEDVKRIGNQPSASKSHVYTDADVLAASHRPADVGAVTDNDLDPNAQTRRMGLMAKRQTPRYSNNY